MVKELLSLFAIALTFIAFVPYIISIGQGKTKPHVFSWLIWGGATFIVFLAQLSDGAGAGAWPIGVSAMITLYIAFLAYTVRADVAITKTDGFFLALAIAALPCWYITENPLWAVVILTTVDVAGFAPTYRKAYKHPFEESLVFYGIMVVRNIMVIGALENYSLTTSLFPAVSAIACLVFIVMVRFRRFKTG